MAKDTRTRRDWTREETVVAFHLYCRIPFKESRSAHPEVQRVAKLIGRTPSSVNMKVGNFGSCDPKLREQGITGLGHASHLVREVWDEFHNDWESLIDESERIIAGKEKAAKITPRRVVTLEEFSRAGEDGVAIVKVRKRQGFFRDTVLSAYESKCCITGSNVESLLVASHIKPWAKSGKTEKLNPQNGLCLNALHDRAFDRGIIAIAEDHTVIVSRETARRANAAAQRLLFGCEGRKIRMPVRFVPDAKFLAWHRDNVFRR